VKLKEDKPREIHTKTLITVKLKKGKGRTHHEKGERKTPYLLKIRV
jgi:hypothetical protein